MLDSPQRRRVASRRIGDVLVVDLFGELDCKSVPQFERAVGELLAAKPRHLVFDISTADGTSGEGHDALGRCGLQACLVSVCSTSGLAKRTLRALGCDNVVFFGAWSEVPSGLRTQSARRN